MKLEGFANFESNHEINIPKDTEVYAHLPSHLESLAMPIEDNLDSIKQIEPNNTNKKSISFSSTWGYDSGNMWGKSFEMPSPTLTDHGTIYTGTQGMVKIRSNCFLPGTQFDRFDAAEMVGKAKAQTFVDMQINEGQRSGAQRIQNWLGLSARAAELDWVNHVERPQQMLEIRKKYMPGGSNYVPPTAPTLEIKPENTRMIKTIVEESAREDTHLTIGERIDKIIDKIQPFIEGIENVLENPRYRNPLLKIINDFIK